MVFHGVVAMGIYTSFRCLSSTASSPNPINPINPGLDKNAEGTILLS